MTARKVTVSLPEELAEQVQALVANHQAASFSGYVAEALQAYLDRHVSLAAWREYTGGPPSPEMQAWARGVLGIGPEVPAPTRDAAGPEVPDDRRAS